MSAPLLPPLLVENVLHKLGLESAPEASPQGLAELYRAWCQRVPFDNVLKLIHLNKGLSGPLPGSDAEDFFLSWLRHGTGGTCWAGSGALASLLLALGFPARRCLATMLVAPDLPPNHGSVVVSFPGAPDYLVDTAILHSEPLLLNSTGIAAVSHPAWGVQATRMDERWQVSWRPLHMTAGFACRFESLDHSHAEFEERYAQTRGWSPFNFQVNARLNKTDEVTGMAFGNVISLHSNGSVSSRARNHQERVRFLIEQLGMSEEIAHRLPADRPTPPPPGSRSAAESSRHALAS